MGIFSKIKQAFGFGNNELDDYEDAFGVDATVHPRQRVSDANDGVSGNEVSEDGGVFEEVSSEGFDETAPINIPLDKIFSTVVEEFNKALPSFIGAGANVDAQCKYLYDALDADVKKLVESMQSCIEARCYKRWEKERLSLNNKLDVARDRLKTLEDNEVEKGKQILSAERQKRALTERIHDLESQVGNLEAEKDQYELETRSLVNKLRVSNMVNEGIEIPDVTTYELRITDLQQQISTLNESNADLSNLRDSLTSQVSELTYSNAALEAANNDLTTQLDALKVKTEMTDFMINDLNSRASKSTKEVQQRDTEIETLRGHIKDLDLQVKTTREQLDEARANLELAAKIQDEVERIQEAIEKKNSQISELTLEVRRRDDRINALEAEENSLRKTIESNLMAQAESEKALRDNIKQLQSQLSSSVTKEKSRYKRKSPMKISAIDEDLDNTDWLVATPPEGTSAKTSGVSDAEFGYQEPQRKNPPENSAQMSLW